MCRFLYALLAVTVGAFAGAIALIGVSFYWFNPAGVGDCGFNVFVMTVTVFLTLAVSLGSLHPQVTHSAVEWSMRFRSLRYMLYLCRSSFAQLLYASRACYPGQSQLRVCIELLTGTLCLHTRSACDLMPLCLPAVAGLTQSQCPVTPQPSST